MRATARAAAPRAAAASRASVLQRRRSDRSGVSWRKLRSGLTFATAVLVLVAGCSAVPPSESTCTFEPGGDRQADTAIGAVAQQVAEQRPEVFVGSALATTPNGCPTLYIKGPRDAFIEELVADVPVPIVVVDNQPFSFEELEARQQRVHEALVAITPQVAIGSDITRGGLMEAVVMEEPGVDRATLEAAIPADLRDSVELRLVDTPVVVPDG